MIRAELYRSDDPQAIVALVTWVDGAPHLETVDASIEGLGAILRPTPVVVDDASLRRLGTSGEVVLEPGSLEWFRAALSTRSPALGLAVRFVSDEIHGGWDPAANYRTFAEHVERQAAT